MSRSIRTVVTGLVTALLLLAAPLPAPAADNPDAAAKAARWVAGRVTDATEAGLAADTLIGVAASGDADAQTQAEPLLRALTDAAPTYAATGPEAAAKLLIVADAWGVAPAAFGGVDLVQAVRAGVGENGSFGAYPGPYASGMGIVALKRADQPVPDAMVRFLLERANPDGGFGYEPGQPSDADNTALAILALTAAKDAPGAADALAKASAWAQGQQAPDGSWPGFNTVNSTAVMGMALQAAGVDQAKALGYVVAQQQPDGSFLNAGNPDPLATNQALLLLGGTDYLTVATSKAGGGIEGLTPIVGGIAAALFVAGAVIMVVRRKRAA